MKLTLDQLDVVWEEFMDHKSMNNDRAWHLWGCWQASEFGYAYDFINFELAKPDCHPYLTQLVSEMVTDRISK